MHTFGYVRPQSIAEAVALLDAPGIASRVLAGGTDLMVAARSNPPDYDRVVDISQIAELHTVELVGTRLRVGAATTFSEVARNPLLRAHAPFLCEACRSIGTMQIANMATLGGNLANAAAAADSVTVLVCLDAAALVASAAGESRTPAAELILGHNKTALPRNALLTAIEFELLPEGTRSAFLKIGRRNALSIARMNLAVAAHRAPDGSIAAARLAAGASFRRPHRVQAVEALLGGQMPSPALFAEAGQLMAQLMLEETGQRWSTEYKVLALAALVEEGLEKVLA